MYGLIITLIFYFHLTVCSNEHTCTLRSNSESKKSLFQRLAPLYGKKFDVENSGIKYSIGICTNVSAKDTNASVVKTKGANTEVLALYNDTGIIAGDSWLMLTYGNGLVQNSTTLVNVTRVQIVIMCNEKTDDHPLHLIDYSSAWGVVYLFEFFTSLGAYLLIGIVYRRLVGGAKGFEQIPHYDFWKELGNLQADGCNFVCRRDMNREESWRRLTNNFNDPQDDALLRDA
ncbi:Cation-dependent mannose-6-phosphate receptor [Blattella germanica]|nr:Cation-dependent mannose-6-phosphate receptor [Blattella germanica]